MLRTVVAHESGDGITIAHCPFCGSGQVVGRSDGNAECQFCNAAFMVRVQPMFSAFPQSVDGMPVQIPGMPPPTPAGMDPGMAPGGMDADDGGEGGMPPGGDQADPGGGEAPPFGGDDSSGGGAPAEDSGDDGGSKGAPPFKKKQSVYRTDTGQLLTRAAYVQHLATILEAR